MALETGAYAAPERRVARRVEPVAARHQGREVAHHRREGVLLSEDMDVEGTLVVVGNAAVGPVGEQAVSQFQQVVGAAVLAVVARQVFRLCRGFEQVFLVRDLAGDEGVVVHQCPE